MNRARFGFLLLAIVIPACADTIGISGGKLILGAEPGDGAQVFAPTISGPDLVFPNVDAAIVTPGCATGGGNITCALAGFQELFLLGGDGDDVLQLSGITGLTFAITALGGAGDDVLIGTPGNVKLFGGSGDDILILSPGNCFSRGTGADVVIGGGCNAGDEPVISPLPRPLVAAPEPGPLVLLGTALLAVAARKRRVTTRVQRAHGPAPHPRRVFP